VTVQEFDFQTFISLSPSIWSRSLRRRRAIANSIMEYSGKRRRDRAGHGARRPPVDPPPAVRPPTSPGSRREHRLISRGACTFALKATNAYAAGASGSSSYNNVAGPLNGTLGNAFTLDIPSRP